MRTSPAASLTARLLAPRGNAHPNRGGLPIREPITISARDGRLLDPRVFQVPPRTLGAQPSANREHKRVSVRIEQQQSLRLRLASVYLGKRRQALLLEALDCYLKQVVPGLLSNLCPCIENGIANGSDCCWRAAG
jgi:hypothetical protein